MKHAIPIFVLSMMAFCSYAGTFLDNFNDGNMDGWTEINLGAGGTWKIENGELIFQSAGAGDNINTTGDGNWSDYIVRVKLKFTKAGGGAMWGAGIFFRSDGFSGYSALLSNQGLASYYIGAGGIQHFQTAPFDLKLDTWYALKTVIEGINFKYYVDDKLIMEYTDPLGQKGKAGLQVSGDNIIVHFDDFSVTGDNIPDNAKEDVNVKGKLATRWGEIRQ